MKVRLTVSYGYDIHHIEMDEKTYAAIEDGQKVKLDGQGFSHEEDGRVLDHWVFNGKPGEIYFFGSTMARNFKRGRNWGRKNLMG